MAEIWLPATMAQSAPAVLPVATVAQADTASLTILAVDDDTLILMNTAAMLEDLDHRVLTASSGKDAMEIFTKEQAIDVLITDQAMPGMTGYQLAEAVRQHRPNFPIILASGYAELPAGANIQMHRLAKPFWQDELARAVADAAKPTCNDRTTAPAA